MNILLRNGLIAATTIGTLATGFSGVAALANSEVSVHASSSLIERLATEFNLDVKAVQTFFDEQHEARVKAKIETRDDDRDEREDKQTKRIEKAVDQGTLTQAQANLILAKRAELSTAFEANRETFHNKMIDAKKVFVDTMQKQRADLEVWARANSIDLKWFAQFKGFMGKGHMKSFMSNNWDWR